MRKKISELQPHFGIPAKTVYEILSAYGIFLGEQLFEGAKGFETIKDELFNGLVEISMNIWQSAYTREEVDKAASKNIPFDLDLRIYFLLDNKKIVYIGQTRQIAQRISTHYIDKQFSHVSTFRESKKQIIKIESINILRYRPKYNQDVPGGKWLLQEALKRL